MRKICFLQLLLLLFCGANPAFAQKQEKTYYIYVIDGLSRADVLSIEKNIRSHSQVSYFGSFDFPVKYFLLKTDSPVTESLFREWIGTAAVVRRFGEKGTEGKPTPVKRGP